MNKIIYVLAIIILFPFDLKAASQKIECDVILLNKILAGDNKAIDQLKSAVTQAKIDRNEAAQKLINLDQSMTLEKDESKRRDYKIQFSKAIVDLPQLEAYKKSLELCFSVAFEGKKIVAPSDSPDCKASVSSLSRGTSLKPVEHIDIKKEISEEIKAAVAK